MKIKDLGTVITGKTPSTKQKDFWNGDIHFVTPADLQRGKHIFNTDRKITVIGKNEVKGSALPINSICVSCIGNIGYVAMTTQECISNQQINSIIPNSDNDPNYVYYLMKYLWPYFKNYEGQSTTVSILNKSQFSDIDIPDIDLETQKKIASILSSIDSKIELNNKINDNLSFYKQIDSTSISPDISLGRRESLNSSSLIFSSIFSASFKYKVFNNSPKGINSSLLTGNNNSYAGRASLLKCKTVVPLTYPRQCSLKRLSCNIPPKRNFEKSDLGRTLTKSIENTIFLYLDLVNKTSAFPITSAFCVKSVCATNVSNNSATCCGFNFDDGSISLNPSILNPPFLSKFFIVAIADSGLLTNSVPLYEYPPIKVATSDKFTFSHPEICSSGEYGRKCATAA